MSLRVFYGGTFDPIHAGHLTTAEAAAVALGVPVRLMPAADPPHRALPGASAAQRAEMLDLAVEGQPMLCVDRRELSRQGRSYTADTLRELRAEYGEDAPLAFVIGADSLCALHTWKDWRRLLDGAHWVVAERPGSSLRGFDRGAAVDDQASGIAGREQAAGGAAGRVGDVASAGTEAAPRLDPELLAALHGCWASTPEALHRSPGGRVLRLRQPLHPASASEIRRRIGAGEAWEGWLLPAVADYIRRHRLYGVRPAGIDRSDRSPGSDDSGAQTSGASGAPAL